jgi:ATP-dependent helicase YprA (DUF1998 family)
MSSGTNVRRILDALRVAETKYNRLVLVAAQSGSGKTESLVAFSEHAGAWYVNVNLELSERLLDLTQRQRKLKAAEILAELVSQAAEKTDTRIVALDNIEILFDVSLKLDPLACLQQLSKNITLIASWNGSVENGNLTYARPGHPEYRKYDARDLLIVELEGALEW